MKRFEVIEGSIDHEISFISMMTLAHKLKDMDLFIECRALSALILPYAQISKRGMTLLRQSFPYLFPDSVIRHSKKVTITVTSYELINEPIEELKANADLIASNPVPVSISPDASFEHLSSFFDGYITKTDKVAHGR